MINKKPKNIDNNINDEIINDPRLFSLFAEKARLLFQLFVLEIKKTSKAEKRYKIIYGWCIKTTREDVSDEIFCNKEFSKIYKSEDTVYSIAKISIYNYPLLIIKIVNELLIGHSLKNAATNNNIDTTNLLFDVNYYTHQNKEDIVVRPIIFNETNTLVSRNPYEKNTLISPYKNVPSFTLSIVNLNKVNILKNDDDPDFGKWQQGLLASLKYLEEETSLPFTSSGSTRFGNIEFINTQCSNEFEIKNVGFNNIREEVTIDYRKVISCRKIKVTIEPNIYTCSKNLMVNCYLKNGEQVILDECKKVFHEENETITVEFESKEQIADISISIWKEEKEKFQIWYKNSANLVRQMVSHIGMVGTSGVVKSSWLDVIVKSNSKTKEKVREAEKVSKASYNSLTVGNYDLDPWVKADKAFSKLVNKLSPEKSEAEFFSKGWDSKDNQHGAISFLEWFKQKTSNAQKVVLQDPFYDTVGLEFLVRTTNANTDFAIITCTQINSIDDDNENLDEKTEPNRALRIKSLIKSNPSLFDSLKLNIYDLRSSGGGDKNILHDRYILIFEEDELKKGFHLSNSIQGATKKNPLLITPIPSDVLQKVDDQINDLITQTVSGNELQIIPLYNYKNRETNKSEDEIEKIADEELYSELRKCIPSKDYVKKEIISKFINNSAILEYESFAKFWSTFGYFLAHVNYPNEILSIVEEIINADFRVRLRNYLKLSISSVYPHGFLNDRNYRGNDFRFLFKNDFEEIINHSISIEGSIHESPSYSNWGVYYGSELLLKTDFNEFLELIKFLQKDFNLKYNTDLANSPLLKLTTIIFTNLYQRLFWYNDNLLINESLKCNITIIKAISTSALILKIIKEKDSIKFSDANDLLIKNLSTDEALSAFTIGLLNHKFWNRHNDSTLEKTFLGVIFELLDKNYTEERLRNFFNKALYSPYPLIEKKITEEIFLRLEENSKITANAIFELWSKEFINLLKEFESYKDYVGITDLTGWYLYISDDKTKKEFIEKLKTSFKKETAEIRKPFSSGSQIWNTAFERILLIRTALIITVLYEADNKSESNEEMRNIIKEIELLETNYQFSMSYSKIYLFSKQILEKYHS